MKSLLFLVFDVLLAGFAGVYVLLHLPPHVRALWTILRRPTVPIGTVQTGDVEVAGNIRTDATPVETAEGKTCVFLETHVTSLWGTKSEKNTRECSTVSSLRELAEDVEVVDPSGRCRLLLKDAEVRGQVRRYGAEKVETFKTRFPSLAGRLDHRAVRVQMTQEAVFVGDRVLVSASGADLARVQPSGYREICFEMVLRGDDRARLLVVRGSQAWLVFRAGAVLAYLVLLAATAFGLSLLTAYTLVKVW
ncbi:MAG: hypothetical protein WCI05_15540 [Myxococcales bacterium]